MPADDKAPIYLVNACERAALARSADDVRLGRFASDEEVAALFAKIRNSSQNK